MMKIEKSGGRRAVDPGVFGTRRRVSLQLLAKRLGHFALPLLATILLLNSCATADKEHHVVISTREQRLAVLEKGKLMATYPISTSKYGLGTIIEIEGEGEDRKLTVSFQDYGAKKLIERYANLQLA